MQKIEIIEADQALPAPADLDLDEEDDVGWGFRDTRFEVLPNGNVVLTGSRYNLCGCEMPKLLPWLAGTFGAPVSAQDRRPPSVASPPPPAKDVFPFVDEIRKQLGRDQVTTDDRVRLRHGHGHTGVEIYALFYGRLPRIPDLVVFPATEEQVLDLVVAANKHDVVLIPFGGGTNVTRALECPSDERRPIVSIDMRRMNRVLWIDEENGQAEIQAGAAGRHIIAELASRGFTMGHEPDSVEFSTLGGWIATNCSGMKKNRYGNIEDIVTDLSLVTSLGVVRRFSAAPRESAGIDPRRCFFGSEGTLGIITRATVKVRRMPEAKVYGSLIFPDFETGFSFLRAIERAQSVPASIRLMDNVQFQFGAALSGEPSFWEQQKMSLGKFMLSKVKGIDLSRCSLGTVVFEGSREEVKQQQATVYRIAREQGAVVSGPSHGERGYNMTFGIAYLRDLAFQHHIIAESFETSVVWKNALELCRRVEQRCIEKHRELGLPGRCMFSMRITQLYATGVCIYFYMGFFAKGVDDPIGKYAELEDAAREEILACGGSLSHHHGVGKLRMRFLEGIQTEATNDINRRLKAALDPKDVFACRNQGLRG